MSSWKDVIRSVAPALATALLGPLGGIATSEISQALLGKKDGTEVELATAIQAGGPDALIKLRQLDDEFRTKMADAGIQLEELENADRAGARARQIAMKDWTPSVLAALFVVVFLATHVWLLGHKMVPGAEEVVRQSLGIIDQALGMILMYFFGSSRGSRQKDEVLGRVASGK